MKLTALSAALLGSALALIISNQPVHADTNSQTTVASAATQQSNPDQTVTVQTGDYLSALATTYGTTMPRLYDANTKITDPNLIYPAETLVVPGPNEQLANRPLTNIAASANSTVAVSTPAASIPVNNDQTETDNDQSNSTPPIVNQVTPVASNIINGGTVWDKIAACESGDNWAINTGNGFYGGLQFTLSSWRGVGGSGYPNQASRSEQISRAEILQSRQGWQAWPACSAKLGL